MKAKVIVQITTEIEIDACGEVTQETEWTPEGKQLNTEVVWDDADVHRRTQEYINEHFGQNTDFEILEINE